MGCWNETCALTNLPIMIDDEVIAIPVIKHGKAGEHYYWYEDASPLTLPIEGRYNEYGSLEDIKVSDLTTRVLEATPMFINAGDVYEPFDFTSERFFDCIHRRELFISDGNGGYQEIDMVMYHKGAYELLVKEMSMRTPYGKKQHLIDYEKRALKARLAKKRELAKTLTGTDKDRVLDRELIYPQYRMKYHMTNVYDKVVKDKETNEYVEALANAIMFFSALGFMRKSFFGISGLGSQNQEMYLQKILAFWVIDFYNNRYEEYINDGYTGSEMRETVFWTDDD